MHQELTKSELWNLNTSVRNRVRMMYMALLNALNEKDWHMRVGLEYKFDISDELREEAEGALIEIETLYRFLWRWWGEVRVSVLVKRLENFELTWFNLGQSAKFYKTDENGKDVYGKDIYFKDTFDEVKEHIEIARGSRAIVPFLGKTYFD